MVDDILHDSDVHHCRLKIRPDTSHAKLAKLVIRSRRQTMFDLRSRHLHLRCRSRARKLNPGRRDTYRERNTLQVPCYIGAMPPSILALASVQSNFPTRTTSNGSEDHRHCARLWKGLPRNDPCLISLGHNLLSLKPPQSAERPQSCSTYAPRGTRAQSSLTEPRAM